MRNYKGDFEKIIMEDISHNQQRPQFVIEEVFKLVSKCCEKLKRKKKNMHELDTTKHFDSHLYRSMIEKRKGIAVYTPSKEKAPKRENSLVNFNTSNSESRFLDNLDMNNSIKLKNHASNMSVKMKESSVKKKTLNVTYNLSQSRLSIEKNKDNLENKKHNLSSFDGDVFNWTLNCEQQLGQNMKVGSRGLRENLGISKATAARSKRFNNFVRKV